VTGEQRARLLRDGALAVVPTDTVYGIACAAGHAGACARLYALKERPPSQPTAILLGSVDRLLGEALPDLPDAAADVCRRLLPGPVTLVVPNPGGRFPWACGSAPERIGVRVPVLPEDVAALADGVGGLVATSANLRGRAAPARLEDVDPAVRAAAAFAVDGGVLPGVASTVLDVTGAEPVVLRAGPADVG
jgi:L-threonylcarbamoyladenylate synthase